MALPQILYGLFRLGRRGLVPAPSSADVSNQRILRADGTWSDQPVAGLPSQTGNANKLLSTDGSSAAWRSMAETPIEARVLEGDFMRAQRDALFFGRGAPNSYAHWSNTEHGAIGANDFTFVIPVIDWWFPTSGNSAGLFSIGEGPLGYGGTKASMSLCFTTGGGLTLALHDPSPNQDANTRRYSLSKASVYDAAGNRPGVLILRRVSGVMSMRLNTQAVAMPQEIVTGSPVSTWASELGGSSIIYGQQWSQAGYLGKLGVPLIYSFGLSDSECDTLVTQGHRALPYRHGSFKNYMPTSGTSAWQSFGSGAFAITTYDLAADPDGVGIPPDGSAGDYCVKITRTGAVSDGGVQISNIWRQGGPVWRHSAHVKVASQSGGNISWGNVSGGNWAAAAPNGQTNPLTGTTGANVNVSQAEGWKLCTVDRGAWVGAADTTSGPGLYFNAAATDAVLYVIVRRCSPLGLLFDGVVQPIPMIADVGPNRMTGRLVNRVDPITDRFLGTFVASTSTNGNQQLAGGPCVAVNHDLEVWGRSLSGTPTINVGNVSGGSQIASAQALTTTWKKLTLVGGSHLTSTQNIWVNSNTSDVVELRVKTRAL